MDDEWLVIQFSGRKDGNEIYIPREMILLVEVIREPEPPATMPTGWKCSRSKASRFGDWP